MEEKIIEFVRTQKCLYDKKDAKYKNTFLRDKLFNKLAVQLHIPVEKAKQRWKTLRDKFQREIKKNETSSGDRAPSPKKEWKWLQAMMFLKDVDTANEKTLGNFTRINDVVEDVCENDELFCYEDSFDDIQSNESLSEGSRTSMSKRQNKVDGAIESATNQMAEIISLAKTSFAIPTSPESPAQLFFKGIAAQVDSANLSPMTFAKVQMEVLKVITQNLYQNYY